MPPAIIQGIAAGTAASTENGLTTDRTDFRGATTDNTDNTDDGLGSVRLSRVGRCVLATTSFAYSEVREGGTPSEAPGPNAVANAIGYAQHYSRSHDAVIRVYDAAGNVIEVSCK